jgi:hypothetical protein
MFNYTTYIEKIYKDHNFDLVFHFEGFNRVVIAFKKYNDLKHFLVFDDEVNNSISNYMRGIDLKPHYSNTYYDNHFYKQYITDIIGEVYDYFVNDMCLPPKYFRFIWDKLVNDLNEVVYNFVNKHRYDLVNPHIYFLPYYYQLPNILSSQKIDCSRTNEMIISFVNRKPFWGDSPIPEIKCELITLTF